jgi:hypothetical protein
VVVELQEQLNLFHLQMVVAQLFHQSHQQAVVLGALKLLSLVVVVGLEVVVEMEHQVVLQHQVVKEIMGGLVR